VHWAEIGQELPYLLRGTQVTIELSLLAFAGGGVLGFTIALLRVLGGPDATLVLKPLVDVVRGSPLLVQLLAVYLGSSALGFSLNPLTAAFVGLSINAGAYLSEIIRGAIASIPKGQTEAGLAIGLSPMYVVWGIVLPQALPVIVPAAMGFFIGLVKDTSLAYVLGLLELTRAAKDIVDRTLDPFETYVVVMMIYFALCYPLSVLVRAVDRQMQHKGLARERL
jgi:polar amino acid transport system permease protein